MLRMAISIGKKGKVTSQDFDFAFFWFPADFFIGRALVNASLRSTQVDQGFLRCRFQRARGQ